MSTLIKQMGRLSVATVLIMMWGCGGASQEQEVSLENTDARLSYGIGLRMGQRMAADGMTVDVSAYAAGLEDAMTGAEAKLTDEEIKLLAAKKVSVVHCPESNMKLASGACPVAKLLDAGLGTGMLG